MAKKGMEIGVGMNAREVQKGAKDVESALEQVADSLDDVAKDADRAGRKMGDDISDGAKDAKRSVDRLERSFKDLADGAKRETQQTSRALKKNVRDEGGEAVREFSNEARQNLSETVSSFRGDVEDLPQIVQDILGGVVGGLGPLGAAAGAAGAAGIGIMVAELQKGAEKAEEMRQQTNELALEIVEAGGSIEGVAMREHLLEWAQAVRDNKEWWEVWQESTISNLDAVEKALQYTSRSGQQLFDAMSGQDPRAALDTLEEFDSRVGELNDEIDKLSRAEMGWQDRENAMLEEKRALEDVTDAIRERQGWQDRSIEQAERLVKYTEDQAAADESVARSTKAREDAASSLQREIDQGISSWSEFVNAETKAIDPANYIAAMQQRREATSNFSSNVQQLAQEFNLSFEEQQAILDQGLDFAPHLQTIMASGFGEAYVNEVRAGVDGGQAIIDGTDMTAKVTTEADTGDATQQLDQLTTKRDAPVTAEPDTKKAEQQLDQLAKKKRTATIAAKADTSDAERAMQAWIARKRTMTVQVEARTREGVLVP